MRLRTTASLGAALAASMLLASAPARAQEVERQAVPQPSVGEETGPDVVPGEIAVDLRDDDSEADVASIDAEASITMHPASAWGWAHDKIEVADVDPAHEDAVLDVLSRDPRVQHAEPMALYRASFVPDDPLYESKQWHLKRVGAERAWDFTCGSGVTVAVIDTGIACFDKGPFSRGTDLAGTRCEGGWNFVDDDAEAADDHGHGTHVAGTIAQTTNNGMGTAGLAYCATLMPVKVLSRQGFGSTANVAEGIRFAANTGAQVINLSLGGPIKSAILEDAVDHALSRGPQIGIAAPGVAVTQQTVCNGGKDKCEIFGTFNGTSMASPHVAGVAAMIESLGVTDVGAVRDALQASARPKDGPNLYGAGILDAGAATSHVFWKHLLVRGVALFALGFLVRRRIRKSGGMPARTLGATLVTLAASIGLAPFLPLFGNIAAHAGRLRTGLELAMRPIGEWDLVLLGGGVHRWLLLASAIPAVVLTLFGFASRRTRPLIGGIALGTSALLAQIAWSGDVAFVAGPTLARVWAIVNALVCLWIARLALDAKKTA
jgi:serine protease